MSKSAEDAGAHAIATDSPQFAPATLSRLFRSLRAPFTIAALGAIGLTMYTAWRYGSLYSAELAVRGYAVDVDPAVVSAGKVVALNEYPAVFNVRNLKSAPLTIVGARSSCGCFKLEGLPMTIPPGGVVELKASLTPSTADVGGQLEASALLYFDVPSPPVMIRIVADAVVPPTDSIEKSQLSEVQPPPASTKFN